LDKNQEQSKIIAGLLTDPYKVKE